MQMKKIFFDSEFTGLHQNTTLISIAFVADTGEEFYAEFEDYDKIQLNSWLEANVLNNLILTKENQSRDLQRMWVKGNKFEVKAAFEIWLNQFPEPKSNKSKPYIQIWGDVPHYDSVLFCELFSGALNIPESIHFMPMDIATLLHIKKIDVTIDREKLVDQTKRELKKHNALYDARLIKEVFLKYYEK